MKPWNHHRRSVLRYVGAKLRIAPRITDALQATGADVLVDVFGGSGAVVMNAGFEKRIYNDADNELVNFFRVLADPKSRRLLFQMVSRLPMSRALFDEMHKARHSGHASPVQRAAATFYVSRYCFGGKLAHGGFVASLGDGGHIKEIKATQRIIGQLREVGKWWQGTVIEHLHFSECIKTYGGRKESVLYVDPPYHGTERHYRHPFQQSDHIFLAEQLATVKASVVLSYYETDLIRTLYPEDAGWHYTRIETVRNNMGNRGGNPSPAPRNSSSRAVSELIISR
jgi:DNA adenine methylase